MSARVSVDPASLDGTFMSEEEYLALPETATRMELVDGLVVCEPSAGFDHQSTSMALGSELREWARKRTPRPTVLAAPFDVRFAPGRILQPDLLVYVDPLERPVVMPVSRIPDLCVEIVSTRGAWDRTTKRLLYARAGVRELWTVLPRRLLVERWTGADLDAMQQCCERLSSPLLDGFEIDIARLFET